MTTSDEPPKFAMKGFSLSRASSSKSASPQLANGGANGVKSALGKRARGGGGAFSTTAETGGDSDSEGGGFEEVIGVENGRAVGRRRDEEGEGGRVKELVIPRMANRDWRAEVRRGKNLLPPEVQAQRAEAEAARGSGSVGVKREGVDVVNSEDGEIKWGLSVRKREKETEDTTALESSREAVETTTTDNNTPREKEKAEEDQKPKTADEEALAALLGQKSDTKTPDLIIPISRPEGRTTEEEAYRRAIREAPDVSTLEDYERVPVEEFGAALLRGMGWKGEKKGSVKEVKRRQNLLGLGAKELKEAEELGAWVQKSDVKRLRTDGGKGGGGRGDRRPRASEYAREREADRERRLERAGGGYRRERERERERERDGGSYRRERDGYR